MSEIQKQLSSLLGRRVTTQIRKTDETPPRISVIDVVAVIVGKGGDAASRAFHRVLEKYPEIDNDLATYQFPGPRQRATKITDARGIVEVIMLLGGSYAMRVRRAAASVLVRRIEHVFV